MAKQAHQLAEHFRAVYFGGNWTGVNLREHLATVSWQQAITQVGDLHTIARLVYHLNYYVEGVRQVLEGGPLDIRDKYSFELPALSKQSDWDELVARTYAQAEALATRIEQLPDGTLGEYFNDPKYGTFYRNLRGLTEHAHYHLGQIVLLKRMLADNDRPG